MFYLLPTRGDTLPELFHLARTGVNSAAGLSAEFADPAHIMSICPVFDRAWRVTTA